MTVTTIWLLSSEIPKKPICPVFSMVLQSFRKDEHSRQKPYNPWKHSTLSGCTWRLRRFCPIRLREAQSRWYGWTFRVWERFFACSLTTAWLPISKSDDRHFAVYLINALVAQLDRVTDSDVSAPFGWEKPKAVDTAGLFGRESIFPLFPWLLFDYHFQKAMTGTSPFIS